MKIQVFQESLWSKPANENGDFQGRPWGSSGKAERAQGEPEPRTRRQQPRCNPPRSALAFLLTGKLKA